jgi:pyridoxamine 5'-phosphate oxidase
LRGDAELDEALGRARRQLAATPGHAPAEWVSYAVCPDEVEFWQGDPAPRHPRLRYRRVDGVWSRDLLWP